MHKIVFLILFGFLYALVSAQAPVVNMESIKHLIENKRAIVLEDHDEIEIKIVKGKPEILNHRREKILYLKDGHNLSSERSIPYSERFFNLTELEAITWIPKDDGFEKIKVKEIQRLSNIGSSSFYDDMMQAKFLFPGIQKGAITELNYTYTISDPHFLFPFYFSSGYNIPIKKTSVKIKYPEEIEIKSAFFGDTSTLKKSTNKAKGYIEHELIAEDILPEKDYESSPKRSYFSPHVFFILNNFTYKGKTNKMLGSLEELYTHNFSFINHLNLDKPSDDIKSVVDSILTTTNKKDSLEVATKLFYWVQDHIKYIAIEDGLGGYIPRKPNDVIRWRYGDCKDKAALLHYMFKTAGLTSNLCWIGTRDIPYRYEELPLMASSNHMILAWKYNGNWLFLDATADMLPMGYPSIFTQSKEALISIDSTKFEIGNVPVIESSKNIALDSIKLQINPENKINAKGSMTFTGYLGVRIRNQFKELNTKELDESVREMLKHSNNQFKVIQYEIHDIEDREKPLRITYEIEIPDYLKKIDQDFFLNMNLNKSYSNEEVDDPARKVPLFYLFEIQAKSYIELEIPKTYNISKVPENRSYSSEILDFESKYLVEKDKIVFQSNVSIKSILVQPEKFPQWNTGMKLISKSYKDNITLKPLK